MKTTHPCFNKVILLIIVMILIVWSVPGDAATPDPRPPFPNGLTPNSLAPDALANLKNLERSIHFFKVDTLSAPESNDLAQNLVDELRYVSLKDMENADLMSSRLPVQPWSDSYWPIYKGAIAYRYADRLFPNVKDWKNNTDYITKNIGDHSSVDQLSPAEKYDLLVGDSSFSMTRNNLAEGKYYYESKGEVETWMGLCHGWAPAAYMTPRPTHATRVLAADGKTWIPFYPSDIKALTTLLWASGRRTETRFIGGRCNLRNPSRNSTGRVKDEECLDNNPGTWHLAIVNQIGVSQRGFVMDATYDYQVWNQPVFGYQYLYFNPKTETPSSRLEDSLLAIKDFKRDKFKRVRSPKASSVVGVEMTVLYINEVEPSLNMTDDPGRDRLASVKYTYDLELDPNGTIVGGEWYSRGHPDFLWTPGPKARALSFGDTELDSLEDQATWTGDVVIPDSWKRVIPRSSSFLQPLARIVDTLIILSNAGL